VRWQGQAIPVPGHPANRFKVLVDPDEFMEYHGKAALK